MQMTTQVVTFLIGAFLVTVGILGGGIEIKEVKIPKLPTVAKIMSTGVGLAFIVLALFFPQSLPSSIALPGPENTFKPASAESPKNPAANHCGGTERVAISRRSYPE